MRRILAGLAAPLLGGCVATAPNLTPVPLQEGTGEAALVSGTAFSYLIGDPGDQSNSAYPALGAAARWGFPEGRDVGVEVLVLPAIDQQQVRASWRWTRPGPRPAASFLLVSAATVNGYPGGAVGYGRMRAFRWDSTGGVYGGVHAAFAAGRTRPSYYNEEGRAGGPSVGMQVGTEHRIGQAFVRAEGSLTYVLPWYLQGSGLVSVGVRF